MYESSFFHKQKKSARPKVSMASQSNMEVDDQKTPLSPNGSTAPPTPSDARSPSSGSKKERKRHKKRERKTKHKRKLSNASIMSIDPYTLVKLRDHATRPNADPTQNNSQFQNDMNRAFNQLQQDAKSKELQAERERLQKEALEENIKISILQPMLDKCAEEYKDLWNEKELVETDLQAAKLQIEIQQKQYEAKLDDLKGQVAELRDRAEMHAERDESDGMLKEEYAAKIKFMEQDFQKTISNYDLQVQRLNNELQKAYNVETTLRESIELGAHENHQLQLQVNDANESSRKYRMLQRKFDDSMKENNELRNEIYRMQTENEELREHNNYLQETLVRVLLYFLFICFGVFSFCLKCV